MFLESTNRAGWIEVVCGSMFSGKTEELIRRLKRAQFARQKVKYARLPFGNQFVKTCKLLLRI